jgi:hypothetical protein
MDDVFDQDSGIHSAVLCSFQLVADDKPFVVKDVKDLKLFE